MLKSQLEPAQTQIKAAGDSYRFSQEISAAAAFIYPCFKSIVQLLQNSPSLVVNLP